MSILGKSKLTEVTVESLEASLAKAQHAVPAFERVVNDFAYALECGEASAAKELERARAALNEGQERVKTLEGAVAVARQKRADSEAEAKSAIYQSKVKAIRAHLAKQAALIASLETNLANAATAYRELAGIVGAINLAWPRKAGPIPQGAMLNMVSLDSAILDEAWRVAGAPRGQLPAPFAKCPGARWLDDPGSIPPLADKAKKIAAYIMRALTGNDE